VRKLFLFSLNSQLRPPITGIAGPIVARCPVVKNSRLESIGNRGLKSAWSVLSFGLAWLPQKM
jgi:hypothetical protein